MVAFKFHGADFASLMAQAEDACLVWGSEFGVWGLGVGAQGLGFQV